MVTCAVVAKLVLGILYIQLFCRSVSAQSVSAQGNIYATSDLYAMEKLWDAWNKSTPDTQDNLAGWTSLVTEDPPCSPSSPWQGVFCNAKQVSRYGVNVWQFEIVGLTLKNASIAGSLPPAIGNLSNLVSLTLIDNPQLEGPIPADIGNLISLFDLDLHGNSFTGTIPKFIYTAFYFLQALDLSDNQLNGELPDNNSISYHTIQTMNISHNLFSGNPGYDFFTYLSNLVSADLSYNNFSGSLPMMVGNSTYTAKESISYLDFSYNKFSGTLPNMSGHQTIQYFNVSSNLLDGELDSASLFNISLLTTLDLSHNQFNGSIPNLSSLTRLNHLDLSYNNFKPGSFPNWVTNLDNLQTLVLQGAFLTGDVSSIISVGFKSLRTLALDDNTYTGTLDINHMLSVSNRSQNLQAVSLTRNNITSVVYSDNIYNLNVMFNLSGNPYCDSTTTDSDLKRCVCQQHCVYTGKSGSDKKVIIIVAAISGFIVVLVVIIYSTLFWRTRRDKSKLLIEVEKKFADYEVKPTLFTYNEIRSITHDFHPNMKLGEGHYGAVYKGTFANGTQVAVKQLFTKSQQTLDVFLNEIVLVAAVKHRNLVKLKGCCIRKDQRLLVHEYVEKGDLEQVLFENKGDMHLTWSMRKSICLGVAQGIHYLHALAHPRIIHRDIKASNILLDINLQPKIADFGLALIFPDEKSHMMTIHLAGTRGYLAPEYATLGQLSDKVDVYSFGVLLLEIVSGRRNINPNMPPDETYLCEWAWKLYEESRIMELIDKTLTLQMDEEIEVRKVLNIAFLCLNPLAEKRPNMGRVVAMLQGDMDSEIVVLSRLRDDERLISRCEGQFSTTGSEYSTFPSSSTMNYQNSPIFIGSTPSGSRDSLLLSVNRTIEMRDISLTR